MKNNAKETTEKTDETTVTKDCRNCLAPFEANPNDPTDRFCCGHCVRQKYGV